MNNKREDRLIFEAYQQQGPVVQFTGAQVGSGSGLVNYYFTVDGEDVEATDKHPVNNPEELAEIISWRIEDRDNPPKDQSVYQALIPQIARQIDAAALSQAMAQVQLKSQQDRADDQAHADGRW